MLCIRPYRIHGGEFGCGTCDACRLNRRRMWTCRIVLEAMCHQHSSFVTLTYADVPRGHHGPPAPYVHSLCPEHLRNFFKRLRNSYPLRVRYFAVGEYGERTGRAHFHAALFGVPCTAIDILQDCWKYGSVHVGTISTSSAAYIAGYVCKKMTGVEAGGLNGRHPEFSRMSRRPGVGYTAISAIVASMRVASVNDVEGDVPAVVRVGGSILPLGQYVRRNIRLICGMDKNMPQEVRQRLRDEFLMEDAELRERRRENTYTSLQARQRINLSMRKL